MEAPKGPFCQSCGMPLARDMKGGGTEMDGNRSGLYCSHCYEGGTFTEPYITVDQMMKNVREMLGRMHLPEAMIEQSVRSIPNLKRWKQ